jgi:mono/diheme cytochrome c family protein
MILKRLLMRYLGFIALLALLIVLPACASTPSAAAPDPLVEGRRQYTIWCAGCHVISADGPDALGPRLGAMLARAETNADGLEPAAWLYEAIVNPNKELADGYTPGLMPDYYGDRLRPEQLDAIIQFMLAEG